VPLSEAVLDAGRIGGESWKREPILIGDDPRKSPPILPAPKERCPGPREAILEVDVPVVNEDCLRSKFVCMEFVIHDYFCFIIKVYLLSKRT